MAVIDKNLIFSTNQAITTSTDSDFIIDLTNARDIGSGEGEAALNVIVQVATTMTATSTTATLTCLFEGSTDSTTYTTFAETDAISTASLTQGVQILNIFVPMRRLVINDAVPRYLKLVYTCSAAFGAGNVSAWVGATRQANTAYPPGFTVAN